MTNKEYIKACLRTNTDSKRLVPDDLLHSSMGICTEAGELLDSVKTFIFYDKSFDLPNVKEEIGDILWYISILLNHLGMSYEEVMEANIEKLKVRYPEKFTTLNALKRNIKEEREVLEDDYISDDPD